MKQWNQKGSFDSHVRCPSISQPPSPYSDPPPPPRRPHLATSLHNLLECTDGDTDMDTDIATDASCRFWVLPILLLFATAFIILQSLFYTMVRPTGFCVSICMDIISYTLNAVLPSYSHPGRRRDAAAMQWGRAMMNEIRRDGQRQQFWRRKHVIGRRRIGHGLVQEHACATIDLERRLLEWLDRIFLA